MLKFIARIPTVEYGYYEVESDNYDEFVQGVVQATEAAAQLGGARPAPPQPQVPQVNGAGAPPWAANTPQEQQSFLPPVNQQQPPQGWPQVPPPAQQGGWQPSAPQQPQQQAGPSCQHGPREYVAKANWKAWMCPTPKGTPGKCDPEWIK